MSSKTLYGVIGILVVTVFVLAGLVGYLYNQKSQTITETNSQTVTQSITQTSTSTLTLTSTITPTTSSENTTSLITYSTTTTYGNNIVTAFTVYLFNGSTSVDAGYFDYVPFDVPNNVMNVTVTGNFTSSGGLGNDIEVFIMNSTQYDSWYNGNQTSVYYDSGQVISVKISNLKLPAGQSYYLIFDNSFSYISGKTVTGEIILTFTQPTTTMTSTTAQATTTNLP